MKILATFGVLSAVASLFAGTADAKGSGDLRALGLKAYWSVLDEGQKEEAKEIAGRYMAETAPDRLAVAARFLSYRAEVAAVLTVDQRREAGRILGRLKDLSATKRRAFLVKLLAGPDRAALADRVERIAGAAPADQVTIGLEIHDQLFEAFAGALGKKLGLSEEQMAKIRDLDARMKADIIPAAGRLAEARASATRDGLALLRPEQKAKLEAFRRGVMEKVLAFIRG